MKIIVKAKAGSKIEKVERVDQPSLNFNHTEEGIPTYKVWVKERPVDGKANVAITKALAKHFDIAPSCVTLISGPISKQKIFEIKI